MKSKQQTYTEQEAYQKLSALCASAEYCEMDMRKKMAGWIIEGNGQDRIIARLYQEKFLDDLRYATAFVHDKFRYNHWGRVRISQELRMRKLPDKIIGVALDEIPEEDNLETLRQLIESKKKTVKGKSAYDIKCKLIRFALGRGFQMDDIIKVVGDVD